MAGLKCKFLQNNGQAGLKLILTVTEKQSRSNVPHVRLLS